MKKMLIFDMDGTIADLYKVENWLEMLRSEIELPYEIAEPLYNMIELNDLLLRLKNEGYIIVVTSWLSKDSTKEYDKKVRKAKKEWLDKYNFPYDEIHLVKYGTPKAYATAGKADMQILVDDNFLVRESFKNYKSNKHKTQINTTINAKKNIFTELYKLLD